MDKLQEIIRQLEIAEKRLKEEAPKNIGKNIGRCLSLREEYSKLIK